MTRERRAGGNIRSDIVTFVIFSAEGSGGRQRRVGGTHKTTTLTTDANHQKGCTNPFQEVFISPRFPPWEFLIKLISKKKKKILISPRSALGVLTFLSWEPFLNLREFFIITLIILKDTVALITGSGKFYLRRVATSGGRSRLAAFHLQIAKRLKCLLQFNSLIIE